VPEQLFIEPRSGLPVVAVRWDAAETVVDIFHAGAKVTRLQGLTALHTTGLRGEVEGGQELFIRTDRSVGHTTFEAALNGYPLVAQPINLYVSAMVDSVAVSSGMSGGMSGGVSSAAVGFGSGMGPGFVGARAKTIDEQTTAPFLVSLIPILGGLALLLTSSVRKFARENDLREPSLNKAATVIASLQIVAGLAIVAFVVLGISALSSGSGQGALPV
jgi:hypothetical protein